MSWHFSLNIGPCEHCGRSDGAIDLGNYTHNMNNGIRAASVKDVGFKETAPAEEILLHKPVMGTGWGDMHGKTGKEVSDFCLSIIQEYESNPEKYEKYEPPNGWGSWASCIALMKYIQSECEDHSTWIFSARG